MANHYVDSEAAAGGDGSIGTPWDALADVNAHTFTGDDFIYIARGSLFRETLTVGQSGTSGHPITYTAYGSGALPKIYGSTQVSTWSDEGSNIWYATCTADPGSVWFVNTDDSIIWGHEETLKASLNTEYDWWWDDPNDRLYVYAASDPDSRYASVEKPTRSRGINLSYNNFITVSYLDVQFCGASNDAESIYAWAANDKTNIIVEYCKSHHNGFLNEGGPEGGPQGNGIWVFRIDNLTIQYCDFYENARRGICIQTDTGGSADNIVIQHNNAYNNYHAQIDIYLTPGGISLDNLNLRYNWIYCDTNYGAYGQGPIWCHGILLRGNSTSYDITNAKIYHNLTYNIYGAYHIWFQGHVDGLKILNNICYGSWPGAAFAPGICFTDEGYGLATNTIIKNNIGVDCGSVAGGLYIPDASVVSECDYNLWYHSGGGTNVYATVGGSTYHYDDFAAYKLATGWDTNGLWENPDFVNAGGTTAADYQLTSVSPCRDAGVDVSLTEDYWGTAIPQNVTPDIGAHEFETVSGTGLISGNGALSSIGLKGGLGTALISYSGSLSASGIKNGFGTALISGIGHISATGSKTTDWDVDVGMFGMTLGMGLH